MVYIIVLNTIGVLVNFQCYKVEDKGMVAKQIFGVVLGLVLVVLISFIHYRKINGTDVDSVWNMYYLAACSVTFRL